MLLNKHYKLPIIPSTRMMTAEEASTCQNMEYDEVFFDPCTNSYKTLSQEKEIMRLREEKELKKVDDRANLEKIIAHFYKKR